MGNKVYKILLIASWYPSKENPLNGSFIKEQAQNISDFGHEVTVVHPFLQGTFLKTRNHKSKTASTVQEQTGKVIRIGVSPDVPGLRKIAYVKLLKAVITTLKQENLDQDSFDIIHSHASFMGGYIGLELKKKWSLPLVHTEHSSSLIFDTTQFNKSDKLIIGKIFTEANKVIFVSQFARSEFQKKWKISQPNRHLVLGNTVNELFYEMELIEPAEPFSFLIIGNIIPVKNHRLLMQAWLEFSQKHPETQLTILGDEAQNSEIDDLSDFFSQPNVQRLSSKSRTELAGTIQKHHVVISTSHVETFGLSIAEAQALGKPVVVTDSGGIRDIITEETGIICKKNAEEFAAGLRQMISEYKNYIPLKIREISKVKFSKDLILIKLNEIYSSHLDS